MCCLDVLMTVYAVEYTYTNDTETRDRVRPEHRAYLRERLEAGDLLASGPFTEGGALLLFSVTSRSALDTLLAGDPFAAANVIESVAVREWDPVIGPWAS